MERKGGRHVLQLKERARMEDERISIVQKQKQPSVSCNRKATSFNTVPYHVTWTGASERSWKWEGRLHDMEWKTAGEAISLLFSPMEPLGLDVWFCHAVLCCAALRYALVY